MQPNQNTYTNGTQPKATFWRSKWARRTFFNGVTFLVVTIIFTVVTFEWRDAPVVDIERDNNLSCEEASEQPDMLIYNVDGKRYGLSTCTTVSPNTVIYNPNDPRIALTNTKTTFQLMTAVFGTIGVILMLSGLAMNKLKYLHDNNESPPTQLPESIVPIDEPADSPPTKKQIMRKICIYSGVAIVFLGSILNTFPDNTTLATIVSIICAIAFCVLAVGAVKLNNILRRERKDASKTGETQPLTIEEGMTRVVIGVTIGLVLIFMSIFALSFFYGSK